MKTDWIKMGARRERARKIFEAQALAIRKMGNFLEPIERALEAEFKLGWDARMAFEAERNGKPKEPRP